MTSPEPITIEDLSTLKASGARNFIALDPEARSIYVGGVVGEGYPEEIWHGRHLLLGSVSQDAVEDSLREYLSARLEDVESIARGWLGHDTDHNGNAVGRWSEEAHEDAHNFREELAGALESGHLARTWAASDWCAGDWPGCAHRAGRAADLEAWASEEASDALAQGVHLDEEDLIRAMTGHLQSRLSDFREPVIVEIMPEALRESHRAARNSGQYPHNGAERFVGELDDWEELADDDEEGQWVEIVKAATVEDLRVYGTR